MVLKNKIKTLSNLKVLIKLYYLDSGKRGTIADFERNLGYERVPSSIRQILLALINSGILLKTGDNGLNSYPIYHLDKKKLFEEMTKLETFQDIYYMVWDNISAIEGVYEKQEFKEIEVRIKSYI